MASSLAPVGTPQYQQALDRYSELLTAEGVSELAELDNLAGLLRRTNVVGQEKRDTTQLLAALDDLARLGKKTASDKLKSAEKRITELTEKRDAIMQQLRELAQESAAVEVPVMDAKTARQTAQRVDQARGSVRTAAEKAGHDMADAQGRADALHERYTNARTTLAGLLAPLVDVIPAQHLPKPAKPKETYSMGSETHADRLKKITAFY